MSDLVSGRITGVARQYETLGLDITVDGFEMFSPYSYQWKRDGSPINGATTSTYTLSQLDAGKTITVEVKYSIRYQSCFNYKPCEWENINISWISPATLNVENVNDPPTSLSISASTFDENTAGRSVIATLVNSDIDAGDSHTYTLVSGVGATNNSAFTIDGDQLRIADSPDFETKNSYSIRIQTQDSGGLTFEKAFTLSVNDINEAPSALTVSASDFDENITGGVAVASLSTEDVDAGDTFTYALVDGEGEADNSVFVVEGDQLKIIDSPDFETKSSYAIRLQTKDSGGLIFEKAFTFNVNDLKEVHDIESIDDASTQKKVTTYKTQESIVLSGQDTNYVIIGTRKKDKITGTSDGEILAGMKGKDVLKGGKGADGFLFNQPGGFGNKHVDLIKDFGSNEGDSLLLDNDVFSLGKKIKIKSFRSKNKVKKAAKSKNDFVYDEKKGLLYFNENGKQKGWGDGGLFAKLQGTPELGADDFTVV